MNPPTNLRPVHAEDREFLRELYASTRAEELMAVPWTGEQKTAFLSMQFDAQSQHYAAVYRDANFQIVELNGQSIGRLIVARLAGEVRVVDIALVPEFRGRGIGRQLMELVIENAAVLGLPVSIHVEFNNPAMRLYERLGFRKIDENGVYWLMRRDVRTS